MRVRGAWLAGAALYGVTGGTQELVVVYDTGATVPAAPYAARAGVSEDQARAAVAAAQAQLGRQRGRLAQLPEAFPLAAGRLRPAAPARIGVPGLVQTMFVIGADEVSLAWVAAHATELRDRGALGVCVAAPTVAEFERARAAVRALGLELAPALGDAVALAYGVNSYPALLEPAP